MTGSRTRRSVPDRARRRAIRALAAELGVSYSVAARLLAAPGGAAAVVSQRSRFPVGDDEHRAWMFAAREHRSFHSRVRDARQAADLPLGRAGHLAGRFPPFRAPAGIGPLYSGDGRETIIAMLYAVVGHESPSLRPAADELDWAAELGEETGVDIACAGLDRAARQLLDQDGWRLWARVEAALTAGEAGRDRLVRDAATHLSAELRSQSLRGSLPGVRHIFDALLVEAYDGLPPGIRVRVGERAGTVVGAGWAESGPPVAYEVRLDDDPVTHLIAESAFEPEPEPEPAPS